MIKATRAGKSLTGLALLFFAAAGLTGCGRAPAGGNPAGSNSRPPVTLNVVKPRLQTLKRTTEQPARIEAFEEAPIYVKIPGYVDNVNVEIGQRVKKGAILAELSVPELQQEFNVKCGMVKQSEIDITLAHSQLAVADANVKTSESLAEEAKFGLKRAEAAQRLRKSETDRMQKLAKDNVFGAQDLAETVNQFEAATAARDEAEAKTRSATDAVIESRARQSKAKTEVDAAVNRLKLAESEKLRVGALLDYSHVRAPFDGVVSVRNIHRGHFLQPSSAASSRVEPLFVVVFVDKVRIFLDVPETDAVLVREGSDNGSVAHIRVPVLNDREFVGKIVGYSWSLDPNQRTLRTEVDFQNVFDTDHPDGLLRPGMYAQAIVELEQKNAWTIPSSAITIRDGRTFGFLAENGKAVKTLVKVGQRAGDDIQVLKRLVTPHKPGDKPTWIDLTGAEAFIVGNSDLADGDAVTNSEH